VLRTASRLSQAVEDIQQSVRGSPQVVADETGWRVDGSNAWLHTLVGSEATYFEVHRHRYYQVAQQVPGTSYHGVMVHDGWSVYDRFQSCEHQTCLAHLMRRAKEMMQRATVAAARFPKAILQLFKDSLAIRNQRDRGQLSCKQVSNALDQVVVRFDKLVLPTKRNKANECLAKHLSKHADQLFTFLTIDNIDATNWRAEQTIRPAVVNRKVWGGNRTWRGAKAQSYLTNVIVTATKQLKSASTISSINHQHNSRASDKLIRGKQVQLYFMIVSATVFEHHILMTRNIASLPGCSYL
jgi:transposase